MADPIKEGAADGPVEAVEKADVAVTRAAARHRESVPIKAASLLADLSDQPPMIAMASVAIATGLLGDRPRLARIGLRVLASVLVATSIKTAIKRAVDRTRPHLLVEEGEYLLRKGTTTDDGEINSFPSGHTADAVAAARSVVRERPGAAMPAYGLAAIVGAVQIPRCRHFLSDVGVGALIGWAAEMLVNAAADPLLERIGLGDDGADERRPA